MYTINSILRICISIALYSLSLSLYIYTNRIGARTSPSSRRTSSKDATMSNPVCAPDVNRSRPHLSAVSTADDDARASLSRPPLARATSSISLSEAERREAFSRARQMATPGTLAGYLIHDVEVRQVWALLIRSGGGRVVADVVRTCRRS